MKIIYDSTADVMRIVFSNAAIEEGDEPKAGVILAYQKNGQLLGMEILDASKQIDEPASIRFAVEIGRGRA